ncbi:MAG TPA: helix-turn-helix domain-containing protein [Bacteroidales bacterium]|nr:helix-turn-helix domain-containing protein [Bacteroidales bacterium]
MASSILLENITPDELFQKMRELISEELDTRLKPVNPQEYITKQEAAEKLRSSLPTIQRLIKSGKIKAYRFGRRVLFKSDEIESCLQEVAALKYKRA